MNDKISFIILSFEKALKISDSPEQFRYREILHIIKDMLQREKFQTALSTINNELKFSFHEEENIAEKEFTTLLYNEVKEEYKKYLFQKQREYNQITAKYLKEYNIEHCYDSLYLIQDGETIQQLIDYVKKQDIKNKAAIIIMIGMGLEEYKILKSLNEE